MSVKEIPKSYRYDCDAQSCTFHHVQENANGHYTDGRPEGWMKLIIYNETKPGSTVGYRNEVLLCPKHAIKMEDALHEILA